MKIICIGRNYSDHIKEMNNSVPENPVFFLKPETAVLKNNMPFFLPDFSDDMQYEAELVVKINKVGKNIQEKFANTYYDEITLGIDFTARDLQKKCTENGLPWEIAKSFDNSAAIGTFIKKEYFKNINGIPFCLKLNTSTVQQGNSSQMIYSFDKIISYVSQFFTLKIGDLIFTGTPSGVGKVKINDILEGFIDEKKLFRISIK